LALLLVLVKAGDHNDLLLDVCSSSLSRAAWRRIYRWGSLRMMPWVGVGRRKGVVMESSPICFATDYLLLMSTTMSTTISMPIYSIFQQL